MSYSYFHSIPAEAVATDEATWDVINKTLRCPENKEVCISCMDVVKTKYTNDPIPYKAQAFRRAAIVVANVNYPLITKGVYDKTPEGIPRGSTSDHITNYISERILQNAINKDPTACFPPQWRKTLLEDDVRISEALNILDMLVNNQPRNESWWSEYQKSTGSRKEALEFYLFRIKRAHYRLIMEHIENMIMDC